MEEVYITQSNFFSILSLFENESTNFDPKKWDIYKWRISFLSKNEIMNFQKMKDLLSNSNEAIVKYKRKEKTDKLKYVYEGGSPSYHSKADCPQLTSKFNNYEIPSEIKAKGIDEINRFREWFKENSKFLIEKPDLFIAKMNAAFELQNIPKLVEIQNSGIASIENIDLKELENRIDSILISCKKFYDDNPTMQLVIDRFKKYTYLANLEEPIKNNDTNLKDKELKSFLKEYDNRFKRPLKELLVQYYLIKYNPSLKFEGMLLDQLGFKPCAVCHGNAVFNL